MVFNELPTAFPWYDSKEKQFFRQENVLDVCVNGSTIIWLISPRTSLLPFQFFTDSTSKPQKWQLLSKYGNEITDLSINIPLLKGIGVDGGIYVTYDGSDMLFQPNTPLKMSVGYYYSVITLADGKSYYSELFYVTNSIDKMVKITFSDSGDIQPIKYAGTGFKQVVYLDSFIDTAEPEIEEDNQSDLNGEPEPLFEKVLVKHRLESVCPSFLTVAMVSIQIHKTINLEAPAQGRKGIVSRVEVSSAAEPQIPFANVSVLLVEQMLVKNTCDNNLEITNLTPWA